MFTFTNRFSKSSSAHSLNNLLGDDEPSKHFSHIQMSLRTWKTTLRLKFWRICSPPERSEDNNLNPRIQVTFTQNHPMGKILIGLLKDTFQLAKKINVKEMKSDLYKICTNFYIAMRLGQMSTKLQTKHAAMNLKGIRSKGT